MSAQHKDLAAGRWARMPLVEQMANVGSEVERALSWRDKGNAEYSRRALDRALELIDMTLAAVQGYARRREIARVREGLADHFEGGNRYASDASSWKKYFAAFTYAARRGR